MKTVVAYVRCNSGSDGNQSINSQIRAIKNYAVNEHLQIIKFYVDKFKSGTNDNREAFQTMINASKSGLFSEVVIYQADRFSRNNFDYVYYKNKLFENGVSITSVLGDSINTIEFNIIENVWECMSEYIRKEHSSRVAVGKFKDAIACKHTGGRAPFGYNIDPQTLQYTINECEAEIIKIIFDQYLAGYTYSTIINHLNEFGYKTRVGQNFIKNSIYSILTNIKLTGTYIYKKTINEEIVEIDGGMPAIISVSDFNKVKAKMMSNKKLCVALQTKLICNCEGVTL